MIKEMVEEEAQHGSSSGGDLIGWKMGLPPLPTTSALLTKLSHMFSFSSSSTAVGSTEGDPPPTALSPTPPQCSLTTSSRPPAPPSSGNAGTGEDEDDGASGGTEGLSPNAYLLPRTLSSTDAVVSSIPWSSPSTPSFPSSPDCNSPPPAEVQLSPTSKPTPQPQVLPPASSTSRTPSEVALGAVAEAVSAAEQNRVLEGFQHAVMSSGHTSLRSSYSGSTHGWGGRGGGGGGVESESGGGDDEEEEEDEYTMSPVVRSELIDALNRIFSANGQGGDDGGENKGQGARGGSQSVVDTSNIYLGEGGGDGDGVGGGYFSFGSGGAGRAAEGRAGARAGTRASHGLIRSAGVKVNAELQRAWALELRQHGVRVLGKASG